MKHSLLLLLFLSTYKLFSECKKILRHTGIGKIFYNFQLSPTSLYLVQDPKID